MNIFIPGTTIKYTQQAREEAFTVAVEPVIEVTGGLTLSQLSKLTGLEGSTIQNWIKRGWVSPTRSKKYSSQQVLRILIINMLRGAMRLDDIAELMHCINGDVEDTSDDIVNETAFYNMLCEIIFSAEEQKRFDESTLYKLIDKSLSEHPNAVISDAEKIRKAMYIMVIAYHSGCLISEMQRELGEVLEKN